MKILSPDNLVADLFMNTCRNDYSEVTVAASTNDKTFDHNNGCQADTWREVPVKFAAFYFLLNLLLLVRRLNLLHMDLVIY